MRAVRTLLLSVVAAAMIVVPLGGIAAAGESGGSGGNGNGGNGNGGKAEVLATLKVENPEVEVKKKGADDFEPATDGQQLRQGDTVRTDATGRAEIDYSEDSYTRLDVNTTFKIVKLTEEAGQRQVEGGLESGRTWNRAEAVTESGSFEQSGGGATAAVTGTAFPVECSSDSEECIFTGVVGTYILKGTGEEKTIEPFDQCDSISGELCDEVTVLTVEELAAISWIQENLLRDLLERGYGPGPFVVGGTLIIQDGVITFEETPPPPPDVTTTTTATTVPAPALEDPPLLCESDYTSATTLPGTSQCAYADGVGAEEFEPTSEIIVYEGDEVLFQANVKQNGASQPVSIVFDHVPDGSHSEDPFDNTGQYCVGEETNEGGCFEEIVEGEAYPADTIFRFIATYDECYGCGVIASGTLTFHLVSPSGSSPTASIDVTVCDYEGCEAEIGQVNTAAQSSPAPPPPTSTSTSPTTTVPEEPATTTTTGAPAQDG